VPYNHVSADFIGVSPEQLRDSSLLSGVLIAAASAAGLAGIGIPTVRKSLGGGSIVALLLHDAHIVVHALPQQGLLLFELLSPASTDAQKALDVFARRLAATEIRSETRARG
jgi:S-adenosylmethionine/arginine decarboxylase-like enzyme